MKTKSIIIGMAVLVVYGLTVAISWDQVKSANAERDRIGKDFKKTQDEFRGTKARLKKAEEDLAEWKGKAVDLAKSTQTLLDAQKSVENAYAAKVNLLETQAKQQETASRTASIAPAPIAPSYVPSPRSAVPVPTPENTENPFWNTYQGVGILKQIRADANAHWGTDYKMVEWQIKEQKEAYLKLAEYRKIYDRVTKGIVTEAEQHWGTDYKMVVWQIKEQLEAKKRLDGR